MKLPYRFSVVLVDDEPVICEGLKALIPWEKYGFSVRAAATNGADALKTAARSEPELYITDIKMPKMNGIELLKLLRERNPDAEVILLTGFAEFQYAKDALKYGAIAYLMKPVDDEELESLLPQVYKKMADALRGKSGRLRHSLKEDANALDNYYIASFEHVFSMPCAGEQLDADGFFQKLRQFASGNIGAHFAELEGLFYERRLESGYLLPDKHGCLALFQTANDLNAFLHSLPVRETESVRILVGKSRGLRSLQAERESAFYGLSANAAVSNSYMTADMTGVLSAALSDSSPEYCLELVEKIIRRIENTPCSLDIIKIHFNDILSEFLKYLESGECDNTCFVQIGQYITELLPFMTLPVFRQCLLQLVYCVDGEARNYKKKHNLGIIARILPYINEKCNENITLKTVADHFYINPAYLGQQFKHKMGCSFKEYINEQKMEKAKKMLANTDRSVSEIARELGFSNANYFTSSFSKWEGCTPTDYRVAQTPR